MGATPINAPQQLIPILFTCKCGVKLQVLAEFVAGAHALPFYQHCDDDEGQYLPGLFISAWEERNGSWQLVPN